MMPFGGTLVAARIERIVGTASAAARFCGELLIGVARDQKHGAAADQGRARHKSGR
jgi:hypothetical protein